VANTKAAHHRGTHQARARRIVTTANADPMTTCWCGCGMTLIDARRRYPRRRVHWTAGHVRNGEINGELRAELSCCNYARGARYGNKLRRLPAAARRAVALNASRKW
jgi:hypothetical protein